MSNKRFKTYVGISIGLHLLVFLVAMFSDVFKFEHKPTKITYVRLSFGDGGTNTKASAKKLEGMPAATIRDQKEALKQLAKMKEPPKEKADKIPPPDTKYADKAAQPPVNKKTIKIGGGDVKQPIKKPVSKADDALSRIEDKLRLRQEQFKQIDIGTAQAKNGDTGQSPWGGAEGTALDPVLLAYYNALKRKVTSQWLLSKDKYTGMLIAKISVMIDPVGHVTSVSFEKTSGDGSFDDSAMLAIKKVSPFPPPPASIKDEAISDGFTFTFNPRGVSGGPR